MIRERIGLADLFVFFALCTCFLFMAISDLRIALHQAVPFDEYTGYLEYLATGGQAGEVPTTPFRERIGAVLLYVPFVYLPPIPFSGSGVVGDKAYLYNALVFGNLVFLCSLSLASLFLSNEQRLHFLLGAVLFGSLVGFKGVDIPGLLMILSVLLTFSRWPAISVLLLIASIFMVEKTVVTIGAYFGAVLFLRYLSDEKIKQLLWTREMLFLCLSLGLIVLFLWFRSLYGNEFFDQMALDPVGKVLFFLTELLSLKGFVLMAPAPALMLGTAYLTLERDAFYRISLIVGVLVIACVQGDLGITSGRVILYVLPVILYEYLSQNTKVRAGDTT